MTKRVSIPAGVDGIPTSTIPTDPQQFVTWFTTVYLKRWAANGDARNAVPTSASVQITGSIGTPAGIGIGPNSVTNGELVQRSPLSVMGNPTAVEANAQDIIAGADGEFLQRASGVLIWGPVIPTIITADSITGLGSPASPLELVNDNASPGNTQYYGTDISGNKGFHSLPGGSAITTLQQAGGTSQVYNVPANANVIEVICIGGGGGGGSGGVSNLSNFSGGSGGGGGGISSGIYAASLLGSTVTVAFSSTTGGTGGASVGPSASNLPGAAGTAGASVKFGNFLQAIGGGAGVAGVVNAGGTGGVGSNIQNLYAGTAGGNSGAGVAGSNGAAPANALVLSATGGGGGGGVNSTPIAAAGGVGGASAFGSNSYNLAGGIAGTAGGNSGGPGNTGGGWTGGSGGGGGGGAISTTNGGNGGAGGSFGGGGGGGGCCTVGVTAHSGSGGTGSPATCIIIAY